MKRRVPGVRLIAAVGLLVVSALATGTSWVPLLLVLGLGGAAVVLLPALIGNGERDPGPAPWLADADAGGADAHRRLLDLQRWAHDRRGDGAADARVVERDDVEAGSAVRRRHEALRRWGRSRGWTYRSTDPGLLVWWSGPPFDRGEQHRCREVLWRGTGLVSCTVRWTVPASVNGAVREAHAVGVVLPGTLPGLVLRPHAEDGPQDRVSGDAVTESPDFNRHWRVLAQDARLVHGLLHPAVLDRLMADDLRDATLCLDGRVLRATWPGPTDLAHLAERVAALVDVAVLIPRHVWQDHGYDPGVVGRAGEQS